MNDWRMPIGFVCTHEIYTKVSINSGSEHEIYASEIIFQHFVELKFQWNLTISLLSNTFILNFIYLVMAYDWSSCIQKSCKGMALC